MTRINRVLEIMAREQVDCVIIKDVTTIRYLSGFSGDSSLLYLDQRQGILITDGRYTEQAKQEMKFMKVLEYRTDGGNNIWKAAAELAKDAETVGFDGSWYSYEEYLQLEKVVAPRKVKSLDFSAIRMVKDKRELELLLKAAQIADEAFMQLLPEIKPGMSERELAARLEYYMRCLGSEKTSFDTIVASGERGALPHGMASDKLVQVGEFITFDFGAVYKGYHSDITRTVLLGMALPWHKEIYTVVEEAQLKGLKAARSGMTGQELDAIVRKSIEDCGYGQYFVHGLGHGVGLEIHELPNVNKRGNITLETGMIFTIEPGIYIPGKGGVRIEDTVILTEAGAKALNGVRKQLIEIV